MRELTTLPKCHSWISGGGNGCVGKGNEGMKVNGEEEKGPGEVNVLITSRYCFSR